MKLVRMIILVGGMRSAETRLTRVYLFFRIGTTRVYLFIPLWTALLYLSIYFIEISSTDVLILF